jgi:exonuclease VII small subunit
MPEKGKNTNITDKIETLKSKIDWFYGEDFSLDDSLDHYKEVLELSREIEKDLAELKNKVTVLSKDFGK